MVGWMVGWTDRQIHKWLYGWLMIELVGWLER